MDHHHVQVRRLSGKLLPHLVDALNHIDAAADQLGSLRKLLFQVNPIVDQHNLEVIQVRRRPHHAGDEDHCEGLAGALGMPDYSAAFFTRHPVADPVHDLHCRSELLIAADCFDSLAGVGVLKYRARSQDREQILLGEHSLNQSLLFALDPQRRLVLAQLFGPDISPTVIVLLAGGDRPVVGPLTTGPNQQQIGVEEPRLAFAQPGGSSIHPIIPISLKLHEGVVHGVGAGWPANLALHYRQRNSIHEENNIRDNALLDCSRRVDAKLIDGSEAVTARVREVD